MVVPDKKAEGESNSQAIMRLFTEWEKGKPKCDVCGIPGAAKEESRS